MVRAADEGHNAARHRRRPADAHLNTLLVDLGHAKGCFAIERGEVDAEAEAERSKSIRVEQGQTTSPIVCSMTHVYVGWNWSMPRLWYKSRSVQVEPRPQTLGTCIGHCRPRLQIE